jgi:hypothetical protein
MRRTLVVLLLLLFTPPVLRAQQFSLVIDAGPSARQYHDVIGERFTFICKARLQLVSVWGTDVYTDDSPICSAAVHAGVIKQDEGGAVTLQILPGQSSYEGSTRNGVESIKWNSHERSYRFISGSGGLIDWGTRVTPLPFEFTQQLDVRCPRGSPAYATSYAIYGSDIYSDTSPICLAAVHAGLITWAGGSVRLHPEGPQVKYTASTRNGVTSRAYGDWPGSYSLGIRPASQLSPGVAMTISRGEIASVDSLDNLAQKLRDLIKTRDNPGAPSTIVASVDSLDNLVARTLYSGVTSLGIARGTTNQLSISMLGANGTALPGSKTPLATLPVTWRTSNLSCAGFVSGGGVTRTATGVSVTTSTAKCPATITATILRPDGLSLELPPQRSTSFEIRKP